MMGSQTSIGSLLASLPELQAISVRIKRLSALQQAYSKAIPSELARGSRVAFERSGTLVVCADTGAIAAKLRHLAPRIVAEIVKSDREVTSIRVELQIMQSNIARPQATRRGIGPAGLTSLKTLRDSLPEAPLRRALSALLETQVALDAKGQLVQRQESDGDHR